MYVIADETVPPAITTELAKQHLRVTHNMEDQLIESYIYTATQFVESFTGLRFVERDVVLQAHQWDYRWNLPKNTISILSAKIAGEETTEFHTGIRQLAFAPRFAGPGPCELTLRVGCAADAASVPAKYRGPLLAATAHLYVNREGQDWPAGIYATMRTLSGLRL